MWFFKKKKEEEGAAVAPSIPAAPAGESLAWYEKIRRGLSASSGKLATGITDIFTKRKLDDDTLQDLEDLLITADLGVATAQKLTANLRQTRFGKEVSSEEIRAALARDIAQMLTVAEKPINTEAHKPFILLVAGVNGTGKTTTIGKLAHHFIADGNKVMLAAGDTFRAAAVGQLKVWAERTGASFFSKEEGADAAALAFEAIDRAEAESIDILMIDTAGRLQNKTNLMEELAKVVRVMRKKNPDAPHGALIVLDATTGQNAVSQIELFKTIIPISGIILTKLDGTAKGGVLVSLVERFGLPVHAIGIGEGVDDLRPFVAAEFAASLLDVSPADLASGEQG